MAKQKNQRKLKNFLFVNKAQVAIGVGNLLLLVVMFGVVIMTVLSPLYSDIFRPGDIYLQHLSSDVFLLLIERCAIAFCILFLVIFFYQIFFIHRIFGPLASFKKALDGLCAGDFSRPVTLRRGDFFKQECAGYTGYIFTGNPALSKKVGLRTSRRIEFYNANIECRLLKYELYKGTKNQKV